MGGVVVLREGAQRGDEELLRELRGDGEEGEGWGEAAPGGAEEGAVRYHPASSTLRRFLTRNLHSHFVPHVCHIQKCL